MAIEVFSRYELKFMLGQSEYDRIHDRVKGQMTADRYSMDGNYYTISNIYYDTPDDRLISAASRHDGKYRYKIRLRTYDPTSDKAFLEIKKKYMGLTNKRRTKIFIDDAAAMLDRLIFPEEKDFMNMQVTRELYDIAKSTPLVPKTVLSYDRRAYFGSDDYEKDLRITFDHAIRFRREDLELRHGSYGELLLDEGKYIMEVKVSHSVPLWVANMLSDAGVTRTRFSKYGAEYKRYIQNRKSNFEEEYDCGRVS